MIFGDSIIGGGLVSMSSEDYYRHLAKQGNRLMQNGGVHPSYLDFLSARTGRHVTPEESRVLEYHNNKKEQMNEKLLLLIEE